MDSKCTIPPGTIWNLFRIFFDQLGQSYLSMCGANMSMGQGGKGNWNAKGKGGNSYYRGEESNSGGGKNHISPYRGGRTERNGSLEKVIEMVKQGQRNSQEWKGLWIEWCQLHGHGVQDPSRHQAMFIIAFVLKYGLAEVVSATWAAHYLVALGELAKPFMVQTIKKGQSQSEQWKEAWANFADSKANGMRDPNRHDAGSLMEFFDTIAMPNYSDQAWMQGYVNGTQDQD